MPVPPSPPYVAGSVAQPRTLNRWLDVNPVTALTRTRTYFTLPAFVNNVNWLGYSELVASYNFSSPNNFSFVGIDVPLAPNYMLCIAYSDEDYNVFRYKFWENVGEHFNFDVPLYSGQMIGKNFRLEVWTVKPSEILSFTLAGAGTVTANGNYDYQSSVSWSQSPGTYALEYNAGTGYWQLTLGTVKYKISQASFQFGIWEIVGGAAPAPYAYKPVTVSQTALLMYTSKLGNHDYMWANDTALAAPSEQITDFNIVDNDAPWTTPSDSGVPNNS